MKIWIALAFLVAFSTLTSSETDEDQLKAIRDCAMFHVCSCKQDVAVFQGCYMKNDEETRLHFMDLANTADECKELNETFVDGPNMGMRMHEICPYKKKAMDKCYDYLNREFAMYTKKRLQENGFFGAEGSAKFMECGMQLISWCKEHANHCIRE